MLTPNKLKDMKKFYPEEYFKRSGYPVLEERADDVSFRRKQKPEDYKRFNEQVNYTGLNSRPQNKIPLKSDQLSQLSGAS